MTDATGRRPRVVALVGPTAVGKSDVALALAAQIQGEIVSADSMQVYRGMDIGTAKPTPAEQRRVPHHLIDIRTPDQDFSVREFRDLADAAIAAIVARGRWPILVGGTGLYVRGLLHEYAFAGQAPDPQVRARWQARSETEGPAALHQLLSLVDPVTAARLHPNDARRIVRALEVYELTGRPMSDQQGEGPLAARYDYLLVGLTMDRAALYQRINRRVATMLAAGWADEVRGLLQAGYSHRLSALRSLGYREVVLYLRGHATWDETVDWIGRSTRRFAKRQLTWFRREPNIHWCPVGADAARTAADIVGLMAGNWGTAVEATFQTD